MENLLDDHEDSPNQHGNSDKLRNETGHPVVNLSMETDTTTLSEFPNFPILASDERNKSKRAGL